MGKIIRCFFMVILAISAISFAFNGKILSLILSATVFVSLMPSVYEKFNQKENKKLKILLPIFLAIALFSSMPKVEIDDNKGANEDYNKNEVYASEVIDNSTKQKDLSVSAINNDIVANIPENQNESIVEDDVNTNATSNEKDTNIANTGKNNTKSNIGDTMQQKSKGSSLEKKESTSSTYVPNSVNNQEETTNYNGRTVYVTPTGEKYHYLSTCGGKNSRATDLDSAKASGYTPCKKCVH